MADYRKNLDDYKREIHLGEFMKHYGFEQHKRSSVNHLRMKNENTGELFIVQKNSRGHYTYWDPGNPSVRGSTVIDFVQHRYHHERASGRDVFDLGRVRGVLDRYLGASVYIAPERSEMKISTDKPKLRGDILIEEYDLKPYKQDKFLTSRGISRETLDSDLFKNSVYNSTYIQKDTGNKHVNTAFIIRDSEGICGIEQRNERFKGTVGSKADGLWRSENTGKQIDNMVITESPVDSVSHYEMNKPSNVQYYSTCGVLTEKQCALLEDLIKEQQPKEISLGFDNDRAGAVYTSRFLGKIQLPDSYYDEKNNLAYANVIPAEIDNKKTGMATFIIPSKDKSESVLNVNDLKDAFNRANKDLRDKFSEGNAFDLKYKVLGENSSTTTVTFKNHKENWHKLNEVITELKFQQAEALKIELPKAKDFNEDLKVERGLVEVLGIGVKM